MARKSKASVCYSSKQKLGKDAIWGGLSKLSSGKMHPLYVIWREMKKRCSNPNAISYKNYGGRSISVCSKWNNSYLSFYRWAFKAGWEEGMQIDRIDNNGNYEPRNCRFVEPGENARNRRSNKFCKLYGEKMIFAEADRRLEVRPGTVSRWYRGYAASQKPRELIFEND